MKERGDLFRKLTRTDQREFIIGTSGVAMKAAHVINAIRPNRHNKNAKAALKKVVEGYLITLWFNQGRDYCLDSRPNLILWDNINHCRLDLNGAIVISPGKTRLSRVYRQLSMDNDKWESRMNNGGNQGRNLDMHKFPYNVGTIK
ncbi:hypothetical protein BDP27DRAFT_1433792 [Rhodocollybia butyracea]|uniref:Uncharacterized protein n=1 Tax=Rhodocollybia butyracea TaxID=206335 RepID=A0A9P5P969_9AGAR|nr:hypothetical protein BDP27DRAFT_1433792 [Rhodocollybia butyracea]